MSKLYLCPFTKQVNEVYPSSTFEEYAPFYFASPSTFPPDYMLPSKVLRLRSSLDITRRASFQNSQNRHLKKAVSELESALAISEARLAAWPPTWLFQLRGTHEGQAIITVMYSDSGPGAARKATKVLGDYDWEPTGRYSDDGKEWK